MWMSALQCKWERQLTQSSLQIWVLFFAALSIALTFYGIGYHQVDVSEDKLVTMRYVSGHHLRRSYEPSR